MNKLFAVVFFISISNLYAQVDGTLDESFGSSGKISISIPASEFVIYDAKILDDESIICTGRIKENPNSTEDVFVAKIDADGNLDNSFNSKGWINIDIDGNDDYAKSITFQQDGKIVVAGYHYNGSNFDMSVVRLNINGTLDPSFDNDGKLTINLGSTDNVNKIIAMSDNKILLIGRKYNGINSDIALIKLNSDGSYDTSFGNQGISAVDLSNKNEYAYDALIDEGKIVVAGEGEIDGNSVFLIARYLLNGELDASFGNNGYSIAQVGTSYNSVFSIKKMSNGKYILGGSASITNEDQFALVSFENDGTINTNFGIQGIRTDDVKPGNEYINSICVQEDGNIVVGGYVTGNGSISDFGLMRYTGNAGIDSEFGILGTTITDFNDGNDKLAHITISKNKKIIAVGFSSLNGKNEIILAKYHNGALSTTIENKESLVNIFPNPFSNQINIVLASNETLENILLYNSKGMLLSNSTNFKTDNQITMMLEDIDRLESGIYFIGIKTVDNIIYKKLLKL